MEEFVFIPASETDSRETFCAETAQNPGIASSNLAGVVTAKTQYSLKNAKEYFREHLSTGDYYEQGQTTRGTWFGEGCARLGLSGEVETSDFLALCENQHPQTGELLTQRLNRLRTQEGQEVQNRRIFFDFTFSPPKSVSLVALVGNDQQVMESHQRAVKTALEEFERFAATRVRRAGANDLRLTRNFVATLFTHHTSRSLDPHLHTHCIVFNATFDGTEQRWQALQNYEMLRARKWTENVYYHELAKDLKRFGYSVLNHQRGDFQIEGIPDELCQRFSKRHQQIDSALAKLLDEKPELFRGNLKDIRERLATAERSRKMHDIGQTELRTLWDTQISEQERAILRNARTPDETRASGADDNVLREAIEWAEEHLFDRRSVVLEHELWQCALERARGLLFDVKDLKQRTTNRGYIRDEKNPLLVTTQPVLRQEWEIVKSAADGIGRYAPLLGSVGAINPELDTEQQSAVRRLLSSRDFISLFRGRAGTGKSYVLRELTIHLRKGGYSLAILAPQRQQVVDLSRRVPSPTTLADFLTRKPLLRQAVVIVDEAGQIGARQMLELIRHVEAIKGRLILSGDTRQHGPVEASDAMRAIERYSGICPVELQRIYRQNPNLAVNREERAQIQSYRSAVEDAAAGRLRQSFDRLDRMGAILGCQFDQQPTLLAQEYLRLAKLGRSSVVVSQTWSEVSRINQQVRELLKAEGLVDGDEVVVKALDKIDLTAAQKRDGRFHMAEQVIVFNQPIQGVAAGTRGRYLALIEDGIAVETRDRVVKVHGRHLDRINVCRELEVPLASGDRLQIKANRRFANGSRVANGELVTVAKISADGLIELEDTRILDRDFREFIPGYSITSYGSQGKTVNYVLFSDSTIKIATNDQQWYVTISRGEKGIRIFTPDKIQLRENVVRSGHRPLALEVAGKTASIRHFRLSRFQRLQSALRRFGEQTVKRMIQSHLSRPSGRQAINRHEYSQSRVLVP